MIPLSERILGYATALVGAFWIWTSIMDLAQNPITPITLINLGLSAYFVHTLENIRKNWQARIANHESE